MTICTERFAKNTRNHLCDTEGSRWKTPYIKGNPIQKQKKCFKAYGRSVVLLWCKHWKTKGGWKTEGTIYILFQSSLSFASTSNVYMYICLNMKICISLCSFFKPSTFLQRCGGWYHVMNWTEKRDLYFRRPGTRCVGWNLSSCQKDPDTWATLEILKRKNPFSPTFWREQKWPYVCYPPQKMDMSCLEIYLLS